MHIYVRKIVKRTVTINKFLDFYAVSIGSVACTFALSFCERALCLRCWRPVWCGDKNVTQLGPGNIGSVFHSIMKFIKWLWTNCSSLKLFWGYGGCEDVGSPSGCLGWFLRSLKAAALSWGHALGNLGEPLGLQGGGQEGGPSASATHLLSCQGRPGGCDHWSRGSMVYKCNKYKGSFVLCWLTWEQVPFMTMT